MGMSLVGGIACISLLVILLMKGRQTARGGTWDCGYARPTARMEYTGASFVQMLVDLVSWAVWPRRTGVRLRKPFPESKTFSSVVPDLILDRVLLPAFSAIREKFVTVRTIQQGSVQAYMIYVLVIIVLLVLVG